MAASGSGGAIARRRHPLIVPARRGVEKLATVIPRACCAIVVMRVLTPVVTTATLATGVAACRARTIVALATATAAAAANSNTWLRLDFEIRLSRELRALHAHAATHLPAPASSGRLSDPRCLGQLANPARTK